MRTTIDLPNALIRKAKIKAAKEGITLKELFIKSLEAELDGNTSSKSHDKLLEDAPLQYFEPESEFFFNVNEPDLSKSDK